MNMSVVLVLSLYGLIGLLMWLVTQQKNREIKVREYVPVPDQRVKYVLYDYYDDDNERNLDLTIEIDISKILLASLPEDGTIYTDMELVGDILTITVESVFYEHE